jgi:predicted metal-dependent hydrolase
MQLSLPLDTISRSREAATADQTVLVRHRKARRYILRVLDDGTLRVTLPWRGSKRDAMAFVEKSARWIAKQREKSGGTACLAEAAERRRRVEQAKRELPASLIALARTHGITVSRISIRNQRSRWGACSARGSITLNWRLILVPDFVREYVMIHELMHRRELNHSARFWGHVRAACPRYREARQWLLTEGRHLFSS